MNRFRNGAFIRWMPFAAVLLAAPGAMAQDATVGAGAQANAAVRAPAAPPTLAGTSDHDLFIGHLGFGWYGTQPVPVGTGGMTAPQATPVVGVRYWVTPMIGVDVGLGFMTSSGSVTTTPPGTTLNTTSTTSFAVHAGVPIALASAGHFSFQVTPELDVGFGGGTVYAPPPPPGMAAGPNTDLSGFLLKAGARVGGEVYFGFIGIPQLALDASVGAALTSTTAKTATGPNSVKASSLRITTDNVSQPWQIFTSFINVRYYL